MDLAVLMQSPVVILLLRLIREFYSRDILYDLNQSNSSLN